MTSLNIHSTVGEMVKERPSRSRVFEALRIDYCCGGKLPLADACSKRHLDPQQVLQQLAEADAEAARHATELVDADKMGLSELADHIVNEHHRYLKTELPRLDYLTEKVNRVHGRTDPRLGDVRRAFVAFRDELIPHMSKEELVLFPMIRQLERMTIMPGLPHGSIVDPIRQMEAEHDVAGDSLAAMNEATDGYQPPDWACGTYRAMLDGLARLERDMHQHVHKENNVLFPNAIRREADLAARRDA